MSPARIERSLELWNTHLPSVTPYYAVKCNPDPQILHYLWGKGIGFDCASEREIRSIHSLGRGPIKGDARIIYANPCKSEGAIKYAKEVGSPLTVVDSVEEVEKLAGYKGGALIRIAVDDTDSTMPFSSKFGAHSLAASHIIAAAAANRLTIHGISFHVGSGCLSGRAYSRAIRAAYTHLKTIGGAANIIDIGGGYLADECDFKEKAEYIRNEMARVNMDFIEPWGIKWIAEPGRFFASNSFDFFVRVIGKKRGGGGSAWAYTIDDSLYGQFSNILFDHATPRWIRVSKECENPRKQIRGTLFGRTCDSVDVIAKAESMEELEVGDWLWFPAMGAYTRATASEFNGFPRPEVFIDDLPLDTSLLPYIHTTPKGVSYVPPVSAASLWAAQEPVYV
jgi:ornithine decarboxylase